MLTGTRVRMGLLEAWGLENDLRVVRREEAAAAEEAARKGAEGAARARARREGLAAGEERSRAADEKLTQVREENEGLRRWISPLIAILYHWTLEHQIASPNVCLFHSFFFFLPKVDAAAHAARGSYFGCEPAAVGGGVGAARDEQPRGALRQGQARRRRRPGQAEQKRLQVGRSEEMKNRTKVTNQTKPLLAPRPLFPLTSAVDCGALQI